MLVLDFQHLSDNWWRGLARSVGWMSVLQAGLGIGLIVRALCRRRGALGVSLATLHHYQQLHSFCASLGN